MNLNAEEAALHGAVVQQVFDDVESHVDRNGKTDASIHAGAGKDGGVDADDATHAVHQRAAGVAGID